MTTLVGSGAFSFFWVFFLLMVITIIAMTSPITTQPPIGPTISGTMFGGAGPGSTMGLVTGPADVKELEYSLS